MTDILKYGFLSLSVLFVPLESTNINNSTYLEEDEITRVLEDFKKAIVENNRERANGLLTSDARILESGGIETREEYFSHHFEADGKFLKAMDRTIIKQKITTAENTAWVSTISQMKGTYNEREISINSAELAVLVKTGEEWKISAVHWSSRSAE